MKAVLNLPLKNEDTLNLELSVVSPDEGNLRIFHGETHLLLNDELIPTDLATIQKAELEILYDQVAGYTSTDKGCLTALRISYGAIVVDGEIKMDLFYKPLYLNYHEYRENTHSYMYSISQSGDLYNLINGKFEIVSEEDYDDAYNLLKDSLTIRHTLDTPIFEPFVEGKDVNYVIVPFQTIFTLLFDNGNNTLVLKNNVETVLHEVNYSVKQTILLHSDEITSNGPFAGQFANRTTWGPPYFLEFGFTLLGY